jgi:hypothetical protein
VSGEFTTAYESGLTVYSLTFNPVDGSAWNGTAFVDPSGIAWPGCAVAMTDDGLGTYSGVIPAEVPPGNYLTQAYLQIGVTPADSDPLVGTGSVYWPGSGDLPPAGRFRASLVAKLNGSAALAALVEDRIFPQVRPQRSGAVPCVVFRVPSIDRAHDLDGPSGMADAFVELTAYAFDFTDCDRVAQVLRDLFDGFTGAMGDVEVVETVSDSETDDYDDPSDGSDDGAHQIQLDYQITFRESTPNRSEV